MLHFLTIAAKDERAHVPVTVVGVDQVSLSSPGAIVEIHVGDLQLHLDPGLMAECRQQLAPLAAVADGRDAEQAHRSVRRCGLAAALPTRLRRAAGSAGGKQHRSHANDSRPRASQDIASAAAAVRLQG
jgi:hypothetical protein